MAVKALPKHYKQTYAIDLSKDRKTFIWVNLLALFLLAVLIIAMFVYQFRFLKEGQFTITIAGLLAALAGTVLILVLHELVHGLFFKLFCKDKIQYGISWTYAYAGCPDWHFTKKEYLVVGLAPFVLINLFLGIIMLFLNQGLFTIAYFIFALHFSGCAGDLYVAVKLLGYPSETLIRDTGTAMQFFVPLNE